MNNCSYCDNNKFYTLANGYIKCTKCKRKYSLKKIELEKEIIRCFCENSNALETSKKLNLTYVTVSKKFKLYREVIISYLDTKYNEIKNDPNEFDEYIYIKNSNIQNAQNFLTFNYSNYIYNLMLPTFKKFAYIEDEKHLTKFLQYYKIAKLESKNSLINNFWQFLEDFLKKYKGINTNNFILYLKEAEFKFNYEKKAQEEILLKLLA